MTLEQKIDALHADVKILKINSAQVFNIETLGQYLGISESTVLNMTRSRNPMIKYTKVGKAKLFTRQAVTDFLEKYSKTAIEF